jgi:hypothetical protein
LGKEGNVEQVPLLSPGALRLEQPPRRQSFVGRKRESGGCGKRKFNTRAKFCHFPGRKDATAFITPHPLVVMSIFNMSPVREKYII